MIRLFVATIFLGWLVFPAVAAGLDAAAINNAEFRSKPAAEDKTDATAVKAQVLLDRAQFSPGEIDGKFGENAQKALRAFAEAKGLPSEKALTPEIWNALVGTSQDPVVAEYKISENDVKGPFLEKLPAKMDDMKSLKALNPAGALIGFFPATVGSEEKPTPSGTLKVVSADANPTYRYNPDYKFKGVKSREAFIIKPGPNNPVGSYWIGLSAEGYGIHGTPNPSKVSKAESHGCIRLTNWDANLLGRSIKKGTPVVFADEPQRGRKSGANVIPPTPTYF